MLDWWRLYAGDPKLRLTKRQLCRVALVTLSRLSPRERKIIRLRLANASVASLVSRFRCTGHDVSALEARFFRIFEVLCHQVRDGREVKPPKSIDLKNPVYTLIWDSWSVASPEDEFERRQNFAIVNRVLVGQSKRNMQMIELYLTGHTLQEIGERIHVTRERVRQLLEKFAAAFRAQLVWRRTGPKRPVVGTSGRCEYEFCLTPNKPLLIGAIHVACRREQTLARRHQCEYPLCPTPDTPVYVGTKHSACRKLERKERTRMRRCQYEQCPTPDVALPGGNAKMHPACRIRQQQSVSRPRPERPSYQCAYEFCPTPDMVLRVGSMHRSCQRLQEQAAKTQSGPPRRKCEYKFCLNPDRPLRSGSIHHNCWLAQEKAKRAGVSLEPEHPHGLSDIPIRRCQYPLCRWPHDQPRNGRMHRACMRRLQSSRRDPNAYESAPAPVKPPPRPPVDPKIAAIREELNAIMARYTTS